MHMHVECVCGEAAARRAAPELSSGGGERTCVIKGRGPEAKAASQTDLFKRHYALVRLGWHRRLQSGLNIHYRRDDPIISALGGIMQRRI
jgi:hypothetical protein